MSKVKICNFSDLRDREPAYAMAEGLDLVVVRYDDKVSVLYGRCLHRGALLADGYIEGENLICGLHHWDYRYDTGVSEYNNEEALYKFEAFIEGDSVLVDLEEVKAFLREHPQPFKRDEYLGLLVSNELMKVIARACGYDDFAKFNPGDLTTFNRDMHYLTGIAYSGIISSQQ